MDVSRFLDHVRREPWYDRQIVHVETVPPREARALTTEAPLHPDLQGPVETEGMWPLYSHQARAIDALRSGKNVIVSTPAASGKSLCYNLTVLDCLLEDRTGRAIYIFPTKALAQDQLRALRRLSEGLGIQAGIFDGDTSFDDRPVIKRSTQILLTNPDMLHLGILPNHSTWYRLLQGLRYVVLDEAHVYRGVFGSHVANVMRRLRRLCRLHGSSPQFVLSSATIANPGELAEGLTGLPFEVIDEDGSPYGGKQFAFWNPPILDELKSTRRSSNTEASTLLSELVSRGVRTMAFVRTRRVAELVYLYAKGQLEEKGPGLASRISPYRASYLPEDRRRIERALFAGELVGVATTNALELGIDVGTLDATVITGYPGSVSSTWQQAGRSGRRGEESLSVLVGRDNPLDQYLMNHPEAFFGRPMESALISPRNPYIVGPHLLCAAYESPLTAQDGELFGTGMSANLEALQKTGLVRRADDKWYITTEVSYPAETVNIRSASPNSYLVVEDRSGMILETVEEGSAFYQLHPGAVYLHQGEPYVVTELDLESRMAYVKLHDGPYYTQAKDVTDIVIRKVRDSKTAGGVQVYLGEVEVTNHVLGFRKRRPFTEEVIGEEYVDLPPRRFDTVALWFDIPEAFTDRRHKGQVNSKAYAGLGLPGGLHAAEHAAIGVLPLFALCDRNDIGGVSTPLHPDTGKAQVFIYDGHPGGIGIAERGFEIIEKLWRATLEAVSQCPCTIGCPSCVQSPKCGNNNHPLDKGFATEILRALITPSG